VQHEIDHLDGILFLDRVQSLTDDVFRRKRHGGPAKGAQSPSDASTRRGSKSPGSDPASDPERTG
jgi:hypothetical protein